MSDSDRNKGRGSRGAAVGPGQSEPQDQTIDFDPDETTSFAGLQESQPGRSRPAVSLECGQTVAGYMLVKPLGVGGFAEVWEVERVADGRKLALKMLHVSHHVSADAVARFQQEGRLAASLSHPRAVGVVDAEIIDGNPAILMEVMPGGTLQEHLLAQGPLKWRKAVDAILDVLEGLEAAHRLGIIHRDIKPSNCFIDGEGRIKIGDFGLSKTLEMSVDLTATGTILGTPSYASPEQIRGLEVDFRSDQYSCGATLYALLTGKPPYEGMSVGDLIAKITSDTPFTPLREHGVEIPKGLLQVLRRLLDKDPSRRFGDHQAVRAALLPFSSRGFVAAPLGPRLAAGVIDVLILIVVMSMLLLLIFGPDAEVDPTAQLAGNVLVLATCLLLEKLWGKTPGKHFMRLRVASSEGTSLSWLQATIRNSVWAVPGIVQNLYVILVSGEGTGNSPVPMVLSAALFVTIRKRNGFAGIHELLSGTRVIQNRSLEEVLSIDAPVEQAVLPIPDDLPEKLGPYRLEEALWTDENESLVVAFDDQLERRVWIHARDCAGLARTQSRGEGRATRLAWLQGGQHEGGVWDAFESPSGRPISDLTPDIDWPRFSSLLADLLSEFREGLSKHDLPPVLSVRNLWVDGFGRLKLLEFPVGHASSPPSVGQAFEVQEWPAFIAHVVRTLISTEERRWYRDLTRSQKAWVDGLLKGEIRESDIPAVESKLEELRDSEVVLTPKRRLAHFVSMYGAVSFPFVIVFLMLLFFGFVGSDWGKVAEGFHLLLLGFGLIALPAILMSVLLGSGPGMRLFSMEVRNARGERAGRVLCLVRALLAWSPALLNLVPVCVWLTRYRGNSSETFWPTNQDGWIQMVESYDGFIHTIPDFAYNILNPVIGLVFIGGWIWAIMSPSRGLHDRFAKTHIGLR